MNTNNCVTFHRDAVLNVSGVSGIIVLCYFESHALRVVKVATKLIYVIKIYQVLLDQVLLFFAILKAKKVWSKISTKV